MKISLIGIMAILTFIHQSQIFASQNPSEQTNPQISLIQDGADLPSDNEKWYFILGIGDDKYFGDKNIESASADKKFFNKIAVLWPFNHHKSMWGFSFYQNEKSDKDDNTMKHISLGIGGYHYLNSFIGDGFFIKGFFGRHTIYQKSNLNNGHYLETGIGYALPVLDGTRIQIELNAKFIKIEELALYSPGLGINLLF